MSPAVHYLNGPRRTTQSAELAKPTVIGDKARVVGPCRRWPGNCRRGSPMRITSDIGSNEPPPVSPVPALASNSARVVVTMMLGKATHPGHHLPGPPAHQCPLRPHPRQPHLATRFTPHRYDSGLTPSLRVLSSGSLERRCRPRWLPRGPAIARLRPLGSTVRRRSCAVMRCCSLTVTYPFSRSV